MYLKLNSSSVWKTCWQLRGHVFSLTETRTKLIYQLILSLQAVPLEVKSACKYRSSLAVRQWGQGDLW